MSVGEGHDRAAWKTRRQLPASETRQSGLCHQEPGQGDASARLALSPGTSRAEARPNDLLARGLRLLVETVRRPSVNTHRLPAEPAMVAIPSCSVSGSTPSTTWAASFCRRRRCRGE